MAACLLVAALLTQQSRAEELFASYVYTGTDFNWFECSSCEGDNPTPGPSNPYTTSNSVSAALRLATGLGPNFPPVGTSANITTATAFALTMSDGVQTLSTLGEPAGQAGTFATPLACVVTNGSGTIVAWLVQLTLQPPGSPNGQSVITSYYDPTDLLGNANCNTTPPFNQPEDYGQIGEQSIPGGLAYAYVNGLNVPQGSWQSPAAPTYTIGGTLAGLNGAGSVVLQDNGGDNLTVSANGSFTFATPLASGQTYFVAVLSTPPGLYCAVTNPSGTVGSANVTNVQVNCSPSTTYPYSGKPFTTFNAGSAYTTSDSVSAALTLSGPLAANLGPTNVMALPGFVSLSLNDGIHAITVSFNNCVGGSCTGTAWVTTDTNGNLSAWYLDANNYGQGQGGHDVDIHTLYDPNRVLGGAYANTSDPQGGTPNPAGEDEGSYAGNSNGAIVTFYGYEHSSPPGSFLPGGTGGTVVVTPTTCTVQNPCQIVPTTQLAVVLAPGVTLPSDPVITQTQCFVPADPRGANCGAVNGQPARSLNIASLAQWCPGYGNEVIPNYACGASGTSKTGFWLNYGVAESLDGTNGLDIFDTFTPPSGTPSPPCPPLTGDRAGEYPFGIVIGGTRLASNTEEQHPEGTLTDITDSCDNVHGAGPPGASVIGEGFVLVQADPAVRHQTNQEILLSLANNDYVNTYIVAGLTHYPKNSPVETQLLLCLAESQILLNVGNARCSSQRLYQCEQIILNTPVATFGPSKTPLRLPDPYGDLKARVLHQFFLSNTQIGGAPPIGLLQQPAGGPYPGCPAL
jgi:hypothetical protein